jgi:hypothetical protein
MLDCSELTLHFDKLSVLSVSKEAALFIPSSKVWLAAGERVNKEA